MWDQILILCFLACWLYGSRHTTVQESEQSASCTWDWWVTVWPTSNESIEETHYRDRSCFFVCEMIPCSFSFWNHSGYSTFVSVPGWSAQLFSPDLPPSFLSSYIDLLFRGQHSWLMFAYSVMKATDCHSSSFQTHSHTNWGMIINTAPHLCECVCCLQVGVTVLSLMLGILLW